MKLSHGELESMAVRATRGAGYPWGLALEAGRAVRWLSCRGADGGAELAALLSRGLAGDLAAHSPGDMVTSRSLSGIEMCPLILGAYLADLGPEFCRIQQPLERVCCPLLIVPFVAQAVLALRANLCVSTKSGATAETDGAGLLISGTFGGLVGGAHVSFWLKPRQPVGGSCDPRAHVDDESWSKLSSWAAQTYAPATEESRRRGAGASPGGL
ncbi:MAG: DUF3726 domain-containing protein [Pseudomonadota bacterium]